MLVRLLLLTATFLGFASADAHDAGRHAPSAQTATAADDAPVERAARLFFSDRRLVTQDGREVAFYSDVLKDRNELWRRSELDIPDRSQKRRRRRAAPSRPVDFGSRVAQHAFPRRQRGDRPLASRAPRCQAGVHRRAIAIACRGVAPAAAIARGGGGHGKGVNPADRSNGSDVVIHSRRVP